jgi:alkylhydroperoxidase family enzyme
MPSYFPRQEFKNLGLSEAAVRVLEQLAEFVDTQNALAAAEADIAALDTTVVALDGTLATAEAAIVALDARIDAYDALDPFVRQDQGAAWAAATGTEARTALASYAGQVVSNPPTQAEMQALDDAVKAISQHLVAFINDARSNGTLT